MSDDASPLLLGIDAGTSRIRALVFRPDGTLLAEGSKAAPTRKPRPGWAEQDPEEIWLAFCQAVRSALATIERPARLRGLAIGSVGEAFVPLDERGRPTYPVIAWYDERPADEMQGFVAHIGKDRIFETTGLSPDPMFTLVKLLWLKAHAPDALARTRTILNVTHYLAWRLTGVPGSDYSQASRTLAFDLHRRVWARDMIEDCGIDPALFQENRPLGERLGPILPDVASMLNLPPDCIVGVGGHDHLLGALAAKALTRGGMLNSLGTAEAVTLAVEKSITDRKLSERGFNQGVLILDGRPIPYVFGGFHTSGAAIEWFRSLFAEDMPHEALIREAEAIDPVTHGVTFIPDLRGKLIPHSDPLARGAWLGLGADTGRAVLYRAILEGLALEARSSIDALGDIEGVPAIETIRAIGGNTRNTLLLQIKASVYRQPIIASDLSESTALGAALLGGLSAGLWPSFDLALKGLTQKTRAIEPREDWTHLYERQYQEVFRNAYAALKPLNHARVVV